MPIQKTKATDYPQAVIQQIALLAQNIVIARKRRKETQAQWAKKLGVSQPTMARIEKGDPSVAMASYVMCVWLINPTAALADLIAPQQDLISLEREIAKVRGTRAPSAPRMRDGGVANTRDKISDNNFIADTAMTRGPISKIDMGLMTAAGLAALIANAAPGSSK